MIIIELTLLAAGLLFFWRKTDAKAEQGEEKPPHLRTWGRFYP